MVSLRCFSPLRNSVAGYSFEKWPKKITKNNLPRRQAGQTIADICASTQQAIIDVLIKKTLNAAKKFKVKSILLGGGVAANQKLRNQFELDARRYTLDAKLFFPEKSLCTDNAAMIGAAAFFNYKEVAWQKLKANPELYFA